LWKFQGRTWVVQQSLVQFCDRGLGGGGKYELVWLSSTSTTGRYPQRFG
jgi:hypothetical protein